MKINGYDYISEHDFDETWRAHAKSNGDLFSYDEVNSFSIEYVWTVSECEEVDGVGFNVDNSWLASPGIHVINALGYVITEKPWAAGTPDAIWYLDDDDQAREDRRKVFIANVPDSAIE